MVVWSLGTEFVVVEDSSCLDTNAIILKGTAVLTYKPRLQDRPFSGSLAGIEVTNDLHITPSVLIKNTACAFIVNIVIGVQETIFIINTSLLFLLFKQHSVTTSPKCFS